jgi:hypothetical protein
VRASAVIVVLTLAAAAGAGAVPGGELRTETRDWIFVAPSELGSAADLELHARTVQLCTDEMMKLIGHRPRRAAKFEWRWIPGDSNWSGATSSAVHSYFTRGSRLVDPVTTPFRASVVARGACFGPHEITHVLTWESWGQAWANEGFATFTDNVYDSAAWRCCATPPTSRVHCDANGYTSGPERHAFSDLSPFPGDFASYTTAACFWWEAHRIGGFPGLRAILSSMRGEPPATTGAFVVRHVNPILGSDLRPLLRRLGFEETELAATSRRLPPRMCTRIGTAGRDVLSGTSGRDVLCGLVGDDVFRSRDRTADLIRCGPGQDVVAADRRDQVGRDCERVRRR